LNSTIQMKSYYIRQGDKRQGPYSIEQLKQMQISPAMQVWTQGLKEWMNAGEIPKLQQTLFSTATVSETNNGHLNSSTEKESAAGKNWKTIVAVAALFVTAILIFKLQDSPIEFPKVDTLEAETVDQSVKPPARAEKSIKEKEMNDPAAYIKAKTSWHKNLIGETVLTGSLLNTSALTSFKNPVLLVTWISKTNTVIGTSRYPIYEMLKPKKSIQYKLKVKAPYKYADVNVSVESAKFVK